MEMTLLYQCNNAQSYLDTLTAEVPVKSLVTIPVMCRVVFMQCRLCGLPVICTNFKAAYLACCPNLLVWL